MGGSGKTTLCQKIMAASRSRMHLSLGCASTALAATLYDDFTTAHSLFKFPVQEENNDDPFTPPVCELHRFPQRKELLQETSLIIWDELPSNNRDIFEAAYEFFRGFAGKVVLCVGDLRQIAPIVPNGQRDEIINASIISSPLWNDFQKFRLTRNLRLRSTTISQQYIDEQRVYGDLILAIGEGDQECEHAISVERLDRDTTVYSIPTLRVFNKDIDNQREAAIDFIFPQGLLDFEICSRAILAGISPRLLTVVKFS
jgi:hypothetical protein